MIKTKTQFLSGNLLICQKNGEPTDGYLIEKTNW